MAKPLLPDELWKRIQPLLPPLRPHPKGGQPWMENRQPQRGRRAFNSFHRVSIYREYLPRARRHQTEQIAAAQNTPINRRQRLGINFIKVIVGYREEKLALPVS